MTAGQRTAAKAAAENDNETAVLKVLLFVDLHYAAHLCYILYSFPRDSPPAFFWGSSTGASRRSASRLDTRRGISRRIGAGLGSP